MERFAHAVETPPDPATGAAWRSLVDLLRHRGRHQRDRVAFTFLKDGEAEADRLTFGELDAQARTVGAALRATGAAGERVVLLFPQGLDFIVAFFGVLYAGATAVPTARARGGRASNARLAAIADDAEPRLVLTGEPLFAEADAVVGRRRQAVVVTLEGLLASSGSASAPPDAAGDSVALLQYTSGSTRAPKGVMITHANILHNQMMIRRLFEHSRDTVFVSWLPMFHDMGLIGNVLQPVYLGCTCVLMSPMAFLQEPARWLRAIARYRATTSGGPNFAYDLCVDRTTAEQRAGLDLSSWDVAFNGSEPVRARTLDRFAETFAPYGFARRALYPCYGMAEATLLISGGAKHAPPAVRRSDAAGKRMVGCGATGPDQELLIVDPDWRRVVPDGTVGEIWLAGPSISPGYWRRPEETGAAFGAALAGTADARYLRTGDLGFIDGGDVFVAGRINDLIIVRGQNHYPQDIEEVATASHPALRPDCAAAFMVEAMGEQRLVIVQEVARGYLRRLPVAEIAAKVRAAVALEHGLHVAAVVLLKPATIPKTSSGKIQRDLCRIEYLAGNLAVVGEDRHGARFWLAVEAGLERGAGSIGQRLARRRTAGADQATLEMD